MNIEEAVKIGKEICGKALRCGECNIGGRSWDNCPFIIDGYGPEYWYDVSYDDPLEHAPTYALEMQRRKDEEWQSDGTRKYVRLDRFEDTHDLRMAWVNRNTCEIRVDSNRWGRFYGVAVGALLCDIRVPSDLIDTTTGLPKKSDREEAEEVFKRSKFADTHEIVGWRKVGEEGPDKGWLTSDGKDVFTLASFTTDDSVWNGYRLFLKRKEPKLPIGGDCVGLLCWVWSTLHGGDKSVDIVTQFHVGGYAYYTKRDAYKFSTPLTPDEIMEYHKKAQAAWDKANGKDGGE